MTNLPTPDQPIGKSPNSSSSNDSQASSAAVNFLIRSAVVGISAIAGVGIGLAIAMARPDLIWRPSLDFLNYKKQQFTLSSDALFAVNKASIRPESFRLLDEVAAQLPLAKGKRIRVNGHTDVAVAGDPLALSYLRAASVKDYLARLRGEENYYWMVVGYGVSQPLTNQTGDRGNGQVGKNNRIEIFVDD